jgi:phospholipid/cholesterol/gamma-HCH transport system substrate-binding protein
MMKKEIGNRIRLGIFVTIGLILFITGIYYVGEQKQLFNKTFSLNAIFRDVSGLQVGNNVRFGGITVGIIDNIEIINDTSIRVMLLVNKDIQKFIKRDAMAIIGSEGLMGNKVLNITSGSQGEEIIEEYSALRASSPVSMDDVLNKLRITTDNAVLISSDISAITNNIKNGRGTIGKLFMDTVFAENLDRTLVNVQQGTKGFKQNMDAAKNNVLLRGYFKKEEKKKEEKPEQKKADPK